MASLVSACLDAKIKQAASLFLICLGLIWTLALTFRIEPTWIVCLCVCMRVCFSAGGAGWWWLDSSCLKLWNGERVMSEGYVLCVFMYTDSSQSRQIEGQPSHLWLFSSEELGCVWVYFQFIAAASHLWLLRTNWLGSGLGRLVALVEVSFPQLLWSFSPQNNFLNTETAEWMH